MKLIVFLIIFTGVILFWVFGLFLAMKNLNTSISFLVHVKDNYPHLYQRNYRHHAKYGNHHAIDWGAIYMRTKTDIEEKELMELKQDGLAISLRSKVRFKILVILCFGLFGFISFSMA